MAEVQREFFDADVHVIDRAGHWPMIDEPAQVQALVIQFLRVQLDLELAAPQTSVGVEA
jgi:pimeloyl-ACP methyl ester carboxylesterase